MLMFKALWSFGLTDSENARAVREAVFVRERGIPAELEFDWFDGVAAHLFVSDEADTPIAAGRLYPDGLPVRMDRIAVMPEFRSMPYYDLVLRAMLYKAQDIAQAEIIALVPENEAALYAPFGFTLNGKRKNMGKCDYVELAVRPENIIWDSPCKHADKSNAQ